MSVLLAGGWWSFSPRTGVCRRSCACRPSAACKKSTTWTWPWKCSGAKELTWRMSAVTVSGLTHASQKDLASIAADAGLLLLFPGSNIESKDIVDGHREKTLGLLWKIMFAFHVRSFLPPVQFKHWMFLSLICLVNGPLMPSWCGVLPQVEVILDENQLIEEIGFLRRTLKSKRSLASLRAGQGLPCSSTEARRPYEHSSTKISLLMDWVRTVSDFYNLKVSAAFSGCILSVPTQTPLKDQVGVANLPGF